MTAPETAPPFRLVYVPGVTPTKWVRVWNERLPTVPLELIAASAGEASEALLNAGADAGLVRLPVDRTDLSAIPLYTEATVVVIPKDHDVAAVEEVSAEDLADYIVLHPLDDCLAWESLPGTPARERPATTADAIELVAAGVGLLIVPQSLARLHHRKDLTYRPMPEAPASQVALSWPEARTTDLVEEFIGIVRGRTVNSSRGRTAAKPATGKTAATSKAGTSKAGTSKAGTSRATTSKAGGRSGSGAAQSGKGARTAKPRRRG